MVKIRGVVLPASVQATLYWAGGVGGPVSGFVMFRVPVVGDKGLGMTVGVSGPGVVHLQIRKKK